MSKITKAKIRQIKRSFKSASELAEATDIPLRVVELIKHGKRIRPVPQLIVDYIMDSTDGAARVAEDLSICRCTVGRVRKDNDYDMDRLNVRSRPGSSGLTPEQFEAIKNDTRLATEIAKDYGVSASYVCDIRNGVRKTKVKSTKELNADSAHNLFTLGGCR